MLDRVETVQQTGQRCQLGQDCVASRAAREVVLDGGPLGRLERTEDQDAE
jgi:hypothetical protein